MRFQPVDSYLENFCCPTKTEVFLLFKPSLKKRDISCCRDPLNFLVYTCQKFPQIRHVQLAFLVKTRGEKATIRHFSIWANTSQKKLNGVREQPSDEVCQQSVFDDPLCYCKIDDAFEIPELQKILQKCIETVRFNAPYSYTRYIATCLPYCIADLFFKDQIESPTFCSAFVARVLRSADTEPFQKFQRHSSYSFSPSAVFHIIAKAKGKAVKQLYEECMENRWSTRVESNLKY